MRFPKYRNASSPWDFQKFVEFDFEFARLAINQVLIREDNLPLKPDKHDDLTLEPETMPALTLRQIVGEDIDRHMPLDVQHLKVVEREERTGSELLAGNLSDRSVLDITRASIDSDPSGGLGEKRGPTYVLTRHTSSLVSGPRCAVSGGGEDDRPTVPGSQPENPRKTT